MNKTQTSNRLASNEWKTTQALLLCGTIAMPLWTIITLAMAWLRPDFNFYHHTASLLELGPWGWVQRINFLLSGTLVIAFAIGVRRLLHGGRAGTWGPILLASFGLGLFGAGVFLPDPFGGFPPGAQTPTTPTVHSLVHIGCFLFIFISLVASTLVFARREFSAKHTGWGIYSIVTGTVFVVVWPAVAKTGYAAGMGLLFIFLMGLICFLWHTLLALRLLRALRQPKNH